MFSPAMKLHVWFSIITMLFLMVRPLMRMSLANKMLLELLCSKSGGVWILKLKTMPRWFLNLVLDLKLLSQSKIWCYRDLFNLCSAVAYAVIRWWWLIGFAFFPVCTEERSVSMLQKHNICLMVLIGQVPWRISMLQLTGLKQMVQRRFVSSSLD